MFLAPQFSILHNAESDYGSSGSWAWLMDLNFLLRCLLVAVLVGTVLVLFELRSRRPWRPIAIPMMVLSWGAVIPLLLLGHSHIRSRSLGGLYEKIFLAVELLWLFLVTAPIAIDRRPAGIKRVNDGPEL